MDDELISKKDLLEHEGISYGQLYRWKRKNLIPEEWFIRKSTFTGQETFFPQEKILTRIDKIKNMKDGLSLDELADMFSPHPKIVAMVKEELLNQNIVSKVTLDFFIEQYGNIPVFPFEKVLTLYLLDKLLLAGEISLDEGGNLLEIMSNHYANFKDKNVELILTRKMGVSNFILISAHSEIHFEEGTKQVIRLNIATCIEELKTKIK